MALLGTAAYFWSGALLSQLAEYWYDNHSFDPQIQEAARKYGLDSRLVKALVFQESRFNPMAVGGAGEIGLMQLLPRGAVLDWAYAHRTEVPSNSSLYSPEINLDIGCWYLAKAMNRWRAYDHAIELALCQYNAGPSRADEWKPATPDGAVIPRIAIASTKRYVKAIMQRYESYCRHNPFAAD